MHRFGLFYSLGGAEIENDKSGNAVQAKFPLFAFLTDYEIVDEKFCVLVEVKKKFCAFRACPNFALRKEM